MARRKKDDNATAGCGLIFLLVALIAWLLSSAWDFAYRALASDMDVMDKACVETTDGGMFSSPANKHELAIEGTTVPNVTVKAWGNDAGIYESEALTTKSDSNGKFTLVIPKERIDFEEGEAELEFEDEEGKDTVLLQQDGKGCENNGKRHRIERAKDDCGYLLKPDQTITDKCAKEKEEEWERKQEEQRRKEEEERKEREREERELKDFEKGHQLDEYNDRRSHYRDRDRNWGGGGINLPGRLW
jgi:hypothetical protein